MTPAARIQAVIELLEQLEQESRPADALLGYYYRQRRYIGSKDKADITQRFYLILRQRARIDWQIQQAGEKPKARMRVITSILLEEGTKALESYFSQGKYGPTPLTRPEQYLASTLKRGEWLTPDMPDYVRWNVQEWIAPYLKKSLGDEIEQEMEALGGEATTDLRVNTLKASREEALKILSKEGISAEKTELSPWGIRLKQRTPVFQMQAFRDGWFEVQDEGSQLIALASTAKPGEKIIDFCAGAGGKTLALAAMMENRGRLLAWDVSEPRLEQMVTRLRRAGVHNVQRRVLQSERDAFLKRHINSADCVVIDAPCSGSGTWRRSPDLKWRWDEAALQSLLETQRSILQSAVRLVKQGGRLIYATCSVLREENQGQVDWVLRKNSDLSASVISSSEGFSAPIRNGMMQLTPARNKTDGFFVAVLTKDRITRSQGGVNA